MEGVTGLRDRPVSEGTTWQIGGDTLTFLLGSSEGRNVVRLLPVLTVLTSTAGLIGAVWVAVLVLF